MKKALALSAGLLIVAAAAWLLWCTSSYAISRFAWQLEHSLQAHGLNGSPARQGAEPSDPDLNPVSVKDLSASASPATKEQQ